MNVTDSKMESIIVAIDKKNTHNHKKLRRRKVVGKL